MGPTVKMAVMSGGTLVPESTADAKPFLHYEPSSHKQSSLQYRLMVSKAG